MLQRVITGAAVAVVIIAIFTPAQFIKTRTKTSKQCVKGRGIVSTQI